MYPQNVATIYAMTEASFSFAEMIGPTFGALVTSIKKNRSIKLDNFDKK